MPPDKITENACESVWTTLSTDDKTTKRHFLDVVSELLHIQGFGVDCEFHCSICNFLDKKMKNRQEKINQTANTKLSCDDTENVHAIDDDSEETSYYCDELPADGLTGSGSETNANDGSETDTNDDSNDNDGSADGDDLSVKYHKPSKVHFTEHLLKVFLKEHSNNKPLKVILFSRYSGSFQALKHHLNGNSDLRSYNFYSISGKNSPRYKIC